MSSNLQSIRRIVLFLCSVLATNDVFSDDRPPQPSLKGISHVRVVVRLDLDEASKQAIALSALEFQRDLKDLLSAAGYTVEQADQPATVTWKVKVRKFEPLVATAKAREALAGLFVYEATLSVQQKVIIMRPTPTFPLMFQNPVPGVFIAGADTWTEFEGGFGVPNLIQERLGNVLKAKLDLLASDGEKANSQ